MDFLLNVCIVLLTITGTELFAWFMHKYLLHGVFWFLHESHHTPQKGWFELNDLTIFIFAIPAFLLIFLGSQYNHFCLWIGVGISIYGVLYFMLHDVVIHLIIKVKFVTQNKYLKRLIRAHKVHHKHLQKEDSEAFGFLFAPKKYKP